MPMNRAPAKPTSHWPPGHPSTPAVDECALPDEPDVPIRMETASARMPAYANPLPAADDGLHEPPHRVPAQPDRDREQERVAEWLLLDRLHRALLVDAFRGGVHGHLDREQPDGRVNHASGDEADPGHRLEGGAVGGGGARRAGIGLHAAHVPLPPLPS